MGGMIRPAARLLCRMVPSGVPVVRTKVRAGLAQAFGPPPFDPDAAPGDPGLFGPGSASGRVIGDPAAIVGGVRALLVQLLHPHAMAGVADHSRFRDDPLGRLQRTSSYVTTTAFGSTAEALDAARVVRRVHTRVRGIAPDGLAYRGDDPDLLSWVSVALTSSFLATDRAYALRPAPPPVADAFVAEQARAAALLDPRVDIDALTADPAAVAALRAGTLPLPMLQDGTLPQTVAQLRAALDAFRPRLAAGPQADEALGFLLRPDIPAPLRVAHRVMAAAAVATIEDPERTLLGPVMARWTAVPARLLGLVAITALRLTVGPSPAQAAAERRAARPLPGPSAG